MTTAVVIPTTQPFNARTMAWRARELEDQGVEWEFDFVPPYQATEVTRWLEQFGLVPPGTTLSLISAIAGSRGQDQDDPDDPDLTPPLLWVERDGG